MKSFNHKCIKVCSSMTVSLLYNYINYHSLSQMMSILLATELSAVLQEVVSVTVSTIHYSNA